mmetsp:Transcript_15607/g.45652  ORF Transcript_15607/g.45652 Transcript_15607/m.45652 type:complete len:208 (-) Transcript_15607:1147-1770(-)
MTTRAVNDGPSFTCSANRHRDRPASASVSHEWNPGTCLVTTSALSVLSAFAPGASRAGPPQGRRALAGPARCAAARGAPSPGPATTARPRTWCSGSPGPRWLHPARWVLDSRCGWFPTGHRGGGAAARASLSPRMMCPSTAPPQSPPAGSRILPAVCAHTPCRQPGNSPGRSRTPSSRGARSWRRKGALRPPRRPWPLQSGAPGAPA